LSFSGSNSSAKLQVGRAVLEAPGVVAGFDDVAVMGQVEVARLILQESSSAMPLPDAISVMLSFELGVAVATL